MANNRMFLLHRPSGMAVYLGKRMATGWYDAPDDAGQRITTLFDMVERDHCDSEDFCIAMEDASGAPAAIAYSRIDAGPIGTCNLKLK